METVEEEQNQPRKVSSKRLQIEETLAEEEEDRISALPDCLILQILSLLPSTKDAIVTGILSKRWKFLWTSIPVLIFREYYHDYSTSDFVSYIDKTLTQCRQSKRSKFEISIGYDTKFQSLVDNWIRFAISCNVEELNLTLWNVYVGAEFLLHEQFFINSCFTDLSLRSCIFNPNGAISWKMLRSLCIYYVNLDEDLIENILSGSPMLETLELHYCYGYRRLDITSKSVKNLVFDGYRDFTNVYDFDFEDVIEINAPNILSLKIQCDLFLWKLLLLDVSSLVEAEFDYGMFGHYETTREEHQEEMLKGFIQSLHHVKELKVGSCCSKVLSRLAAKGFPFPSNMKSLIVIRL